jgi:threonine 3-dehydrogenase
MNNVSTPLTMKVPRFKGGGFIEFEEISVPKPGPGQLLIQVKANALCGSERGQFINGSVVIPGHEAAGVVVAAGKHTRVPIGTPGVIYLMDFCGTCRACSQGFTNQCRNKRGDMGFNKDGGYAPYELINENIFFPIDKNIPFPEATMLLDIIGTGGHAIDRGRILHPDIQSVFVMGAGPIGLGVLAMAKIIIGKEIPVFVSDFEDYRLEIVEKLGGIPLNLKKKSLHEFFMENDVKAVDLSIDTSGKKAARQSGLKVLDQQGALICVGHGEELHIDGSKDLIHPERAILGSEYFPYRDLERNLDILNRHFEYFSAIITHRFEAEKIKEAFDLFLKGQTGKVVIVQ